MMKDFAKSAALVLAASVFTFNGGKVVSAAQFYEYARVNLNATSTVGGPSEIGSNPVSVAWNGTDAIIAGYNGGSTARDVALVKVSAPLTAPSIGQRFGVRTATPAGRGYLSLDIKGTTDISASFDSGTASSSANAIYNYDGSERWSVAPNIRPNVGAAFDPLSSRVSFMYQGTSAIQNFDVTNGTFTGNVVPQTNSIAGIGTAFRDLDYNNVTGDAWFRLNNNVVRGNRVNATTYSDPATLVVDLTDANQVGQSIAYLNGLATEFAIYNNRSSAASGQVFTSVVAGVRNDGTAEALSFLNADGSAAATFGTSVALYDFSWDAASKTLAIVDYSNRELLIFGTTVVPEPASAGLVGVAMLGLVKRRRR